MADLTSQFPYFHGAIHWPRLMFKFLPLKYNWLVVFCMTIKKLWRQNDVNLAKIRHVSDYNLLTDVVLEHNLQIYSKAQWSQL